MTTKKTHWSEAIITKLDPCSEAADWMRTQKSAAIAWRKCDNPSWMCWILGRLCDSAAKRKRIVLIACACAETALKYVPESEARPVEAIRTARAWTQGRATIEHVRDAAAYAASAANAANAAYAAAYAAYAANAAEAAAAANAAYAADAAEAAAAANAAYAANAAEVASYAAAAANAAEAANAAANAADAAAAREKARRQCADIVRKFVPAVGGIYWE